MKIPSTTYDPKSSKLYAYAHFKRDGHFLRVIRNAAGDLSCWSSKPLDITSQILHLPIVEHGLFDRLPKGAGIAGELWASGKPASEIKTLINARSDALRFEAFAITGWPNIVDIDRMRLETVQRTLNNINISFVPFVVVRDFEHQRYLTDSWKVSTAKVDPDIEGFVFKNGNLSDWCKFKPRKTIDLIICGYTAGEGKYNGLIGSINCKTLEGYPTCSCSGMTDLQRKYISENSDKLIGSVVEVEYQSVGAGGRLRHPEFVSIREDKDALGCSVTQDLDLQAYWTSREFLFKE